MWSLTAEIDGARWPVTWRLATSEIHHQLGSNTIAIGYSNDEEGAAHARCLEICNRPCRNPSRSKPYSRSAVALSRAAMNTCFGTT